MHARAARTPRASVTPVSEDRPSATPGPDAEVTTLLRQLAAALDGGPPLVLGAAPTPALPRSVAVVLRTSGSASGSGRPVGLSATALRASATATHERLGGPGRWVLTLPPRHVAGVQVLVRSLLAGTRPVVTPPGGFDPDALATAVARAGHDERVYVSLVPTQLHRVLGEDPGAARARRALAGVDAVLVGGAATAPVLLDRARSANVPVVTTYGMTETSGGCVYDGVPLTDVQVRLDGDRILLAGPVLAEGYLDDGPQPFEVADGTRWFRTSDVGTLDHLNQGVLRVLGRADDVLLTGGVNVHPLEVERALEPHGGEVVVVGVPDPEWGQLVTAVVTEPVPLATLRELVGGGPRAPRAVVRVESLPRLGPGKVDRRAVAELARAALARGSGERL